MTPPFEIAVVVAKKLDRLRPVWAIALFVVFVSALCAYLLWLAAFG